MSNQTHLADRLVTLSIRVSCCLFSRSELSESCALTHTAVGVEYLTNSAALPFMLLRNGKP
ncbi:hypothetical protein DY000_02059135 [Brassica cretica]|uniref:Uncharacterized protein n=1 Tax=Brassica cretica TaxID=69181 RepID=A0ABQ7APQ9_BRACR|nr:hypothetical protein DY000_02059135 [Brassica cretica]